VNGSFDDLSPDELALQPRVRGDRLDPASPLAVFFVGGEHPLQARTLPLFKDVFGAGFGQVLFVSVGAADAEWTDAGVLGAGEFKGSEEARRLLLRTRRGLDECLLWARQAGLKADGRVSVAAKVPDECGRLADEIAERHPKAAFFVSKLAFPKRGWLHGLLQGNAADAIRSRLEKRGRPVVVIPVVLPA
jgi:hypothetical protein